MNKIDRKLPSRTVLLGLLTLGVMVATFAISTAQAALSVTRLTPPSTLFIANNPNPPIISRFLPGQRFDLQATVSPDAGRTISGARFSVDGTIIPGTVTLFSATAAGQPPNSVVVSLRAYANSVGRIHTLSITATQSDNMTITATGNFEVVPITPTTWGARNIIILIGDGMGIAHRTAARIMKNGVALGKAIAPLSMDLLPFTGTVTTHSLNSIVTDSSPGASCYATGNKANNNQHGVFPDDTTDNGDNPRVESMGEYLHRTQGRSLGIVTTTDLFDSTPGAFGSHTQSRTLGSGICDEFFDERNATGLTVLMGGGRKWFLPTNTIGSGRTAALDYVIPASVASAWGIPQGTNDPGRDLLGDFIADGFTYAPNATALNAIPSTTTKLLGLFNFSNMNVAKDKIDGRRNGGGTNVVDDFGFPDQPMLDEMTDKALMVLSQNSNGFVAMIEGGSIDKQAHLMDSDRWMIDAIEFDRAIERCRKILQEDLGAKVPAGSDLVEESLTQTFVTGQTSGDLLSGVMRIDTFTAVSLSREQLARDVAGKSPEEAEALLRESGKVSDIQIDLSPFWVSSIPDEVSKIVIHYRTAAAAPSPSPSPTATVTPATTVDGSPLPSLPPSL